MIETVTLRCFDPVAVPQEKERMDKGVAILEQQGFVIVRTSEAYYEKVTATRHIYIDPFGKVCING